MPLLLAIGPFTTRTALATATRTTLTALAPTLTLLLLHLLVLDELILGQDALDGVVLSLLALFHLSAEVLHVALLRTLALLHLGKLLLLNLSLTEEVVVESLGLLLVGLASLLDTVGLALGHVLGFELTALAALRLLCKSTGADGKSHDSEENLFHFSRFFNE